MRVGGLPGWTMCQADPCRWHLADAFLCHGTRRLVRIPRQPGYGYPNADSQVRGKPFESGIAAPFGDASQASGRRPALPGRNVCCRGKTKRLLSYGALCVSPSVRGSRLLRLVLSRRRTCCAGRRAWRRPAYGLGQDYWQADCCDGSSKPLRNRISPVGRTWKVTFSLALTPPGAVVAFNVEW